MEESSSRSLRNPCNARSGQATIFFRSRVCVDQALAAAFNTAADQSRETYDKEPRDIPHHLADLNMVTQ
jgi:hypothetical protein